MDLEKEFNALIPKEFGGQMDTEMLKSFIEICELSSKIAIQDYLLEHGANDEKINDKVRKLKGLKL